MKKVLITGASGFIGSYLKEHLTGYEISTLSLRDPNWRLQPIDADVVIHCAGIAHSIGKSNSQYNEINIQRTIELNELIISSNVRHIIYFSTIQVFGNLENAITYSTELNPSNPYADSKKKAEDNIINSSIYLKSIIRLPLVLGTKPKGNLKLLSYLRKINPFFIKTNNSRSILLIEDLLKVVNELIEHPRNCIIHPCSKNVSTTEIYLMISRMLDMSDPIIFPLPALTLILLKKMPIIGKRIFGNNYYQEPFEKRLVEINENSSN
jgi:UDP-glucose 4-epimerase